ncbi:phenylalanine--tRNA ligase subunit alpha [Candidatus Pacearchaeota archaeon]|nr:phenylalanine--tRNA ligase subunit alpha [Candidatus Pacearchaeota archaeon]
MVDTSKKENKVNKRLIESLSPNERKIIPLLKEKSIVSISKKSNLDKVSVLRSLEYLQNKDIVKLSSNKKKIVEIGINGALYKKKGLPERRLLNLLGKKRIIKLQDAKKQSGLSNNEFKASIGALKKKALIELKNGKIVFSGKKQDISKKSIEERFLESLPIEYEKLPPEYQLALKSLQNRKDIVCVLEKKSVNIKVTELGERVMNSTIDAGDMIESLTPEIVQNKKLWKGKKFRRYDVTSSVPEIVGGKRHFVNQSIDYARKIWTEMGFQEMNGTMLISSFWNFDALFTAQDHPVRELQDTFYIDKQIPLPADKDLIETVKKTHEKGISGSKGWNYEWEENDAKKLVLRTHTTCLSAQTLYKLSKLPEDKRKGKFFAIGKVFRNETVDWSHGFEFNQTEGIVVDDNVNFRHLLGYLQQFYKKMGFEKVRFVPAYFPYTEPSVEIHAYHPEKKVWLELGGAGMFRPEISVPLLGKNTPILAWGQGFDRIIMDYYKINDLRELYKNDLSQLRKIKAWMKN